MANGTAVVINNKMFSIGSKVQIAGETFQVMNTYPQAQSIFFAKVNKSGELAKPGKGTMGSYSFDEIAAYMSIGVIA